MHKNFGDRFMGLRGFVWVAFRHFRAFKAMWIAAFFAFGACRILAANRSWFPIGGDEGDRGDFDEATAIGGRISICWFSPGGARSRGLRLSVSAGLHVC